MGRDRGIFHRIFVVKHSVFVPLFSQVCIMFFTFWQFRQGGWTPRLTQNSLELALGAVVTVEAVADSSSVVAQTAAGTIATRLVTITLEHVGPRGALNQRAVRPTPPKIADAPHVLF